IQATDYFDAEGLPSPVTHYWSLSVEEQFYFIWPFVMMAAAAIASRFKKSLSASLTFALLAIFAASLAASIYFTQTDPASAYFATYTRVWELALGGLGALVFNKRQRNSFAAAPFVAAIGIIAIGITAFTYSGKTAFPGYAALVPTVAALAIILAGDVKFLWFKGLNNKILHYVGDRSYSIYLWHWPVIIFYKTYDSRIGYIDGTALLLITLLLSEFSYRFVEEKFR